MSLKPLAQLTKPLRVAILVTVGIAGLSALLQLVDAVLYLVAYEAVPEPVIVLADLAVALIGLIVAASGTVAVVLFLMWLYRANNNLQAATGQRLENTPGMAVLWFFIPVANFFMPHRAMKEVWYGSHLGQVDEHSKVNRLWALWIAGIIYSIPISILMTSAKEPGAQGIALLAYVGNDGLAIVRWLAMLALVLAISSAFASNVDETIVVTPQTLSTVAAGWYADPARRHGLRFWDGARWTDWVADGETQSQDPL